jgi:glycine betaine catabolism B
VPGPVPGTVFSVEFARSGRTVACQPGTFILDAALRAGLTPPSSCGEGMCGTCKTTLVSGSVDMSHNGGIRPREIAARKILLCCSTPLEDLVIDA